MTHGSSLKKITVALGVVFFTVGCGPSHEIHNEPVSELNAGFEIFQSEIYALGNSKKCSICHAQTFNPHWVAPDPQRAYTIAKALVDFKNPTQSILVEFASNGHCRSPECSDPATSETMKAALQNWAAAELGVGWIF